MPDEHATQGMRRGQVKLWGTQRVFAVCAVLKAVVETQRIHAIHDFPIAARITVPEVIERFRGIQVAGHDEGLLS
jgi:hypothetical protein